MAKTRVLRAILAPAARQDLRDVLRWSEQKFGEAAARCYVALVKQALRDISADSERPGSKERHEIMTDGARTYHIALSRDRVTGAKVKEPRHFLLYRHREEGAIEVARILHDGRDLARGFAWQKDIPDGFGRKDIS